jgi:hypothetical protein
VTWKPLRLSGGDALAVRASKKLRSDESLVTSLGATILRKHLDEVPLWRGDHVAIRQLAEDFARYLYLPRLRDQQVLLSAIRDGLSLLMWHRDSFAFADSFDADVGRYRGLRGGQPAGGSLEHADALLVKPDVAKRQLDAEAAPAPAAGGAAGVPPNGSSGDPGHGEVRDGERGAPPTPVLLTRFHGSVDINATRVSRDVGIISTEIITHLTGLVGAKVRITLDIEAEVPAGVPPNVVRIVTENAKTLKFGSHGFEEK